MSSFISLLRNRISQCNPGDLHAAAEAGSFTHAGDSLRMSQSAVSRQVSALEKDLGVALFHRHARGLVLTEQGDLLFRTATEILTKLSTAETLLADTTTKPSGELRVTRRWGWIRLADAAAAEFIDSTPRSGRVGPHRRESTFRCARRCRNLVPRAAQRTHPQTVVHHALPGLRLARVHQAARRTLDAGRPRQAPRSHLRGPGIAHSREINYLEIAGREGREGRQGALAVNNVYG